jgi:hypothetical protein
MNLFTKSLISELVGDNIVTALYGGGFKPPTKGHFEVVQKALTEFPEIDKFIVYVGSGERNGITQAESLLIWEIYKKYLGDKVEIQPSKAPIGDIIRYGKSHPEEVVYFIIGARDGNEGDLQDVALRTSGVEDKYPNVKIKVIQTPDASISGTKAREASKKSPEAFYKFLPPVINDNERLEIFGYIQDVVTEIVTDTEVICDGCGWEWSIVDGGDDLYMCHKCGHDNSPKQLNENASYSSDIDVKEKILELTKHMLAKGMNIKPLPKVKFVNGDSNNAREFLGKTAYYDPNNFTITLYTEGRHPKDIVRSFSHEMIHHIQNLENRLGDVSTTNTMEDDNIDKLEQEANLKGTMTFRNWTDSLNENLTKNSNYLYHWTSYSACKKIIESNKLKSNESNQFFEYDESRDLPDYKNVVFFTIEDERFADEENSNQCILVVDKSKLSKDYKVISYGDPYEEIIVYTNDSSIPILSYLKGVVLMNTLQKSGVKNLVQFLELKNIPYEINDNLEKQTTAKKAMLPTLKKELINKLKSKYPNGFIGYLNSPLKDLQTPEYFKDNSTYSYPNITINKPGEYGEKNKFQVKFKIEPQNLEKYINWFMYSPDSIEDLINMDNYEGEELWLKGNIPIDPTTLQEANLKGTMTFRNWTDSLNENIAPLKSHKVYHSTDSKFEDFSLDYAWDGFWFTDDLDSLKNRTAGASGGKYILTRYITLKNPAGWDEYDKYSIGELIGMGYDGVILPDPGRTDYIVFNPKSISKNIDSLNEVGEGSSKPYEWREDFDEYVFTTDSNVGYIVSLSEMPEGGKMGIAVEFLAKTPEMDGYSSKIEVGRGELFRVMATIIDIIKSHLSKNPEIEFILYSPSKKTGEGDIGNQRDKLYKIFLQKQIPGIRIRDIGTSAVIAYLPKRDELNLEINKPGDGNAAPYGSGYNKVNELRQGFLNYLKQQLPNFPDYVIKDWIYKMIKKDDNINTAEGIQDWIDTQLKDLKWETKINFPITMDIFGDKTQKELKSRIGGEIRQDVDKDIERHKTQQNLLKSQGISKEPIIIFKTKDGKYELGEGWHRTTQSFKMYPEGFIQPNVYIGLNAKWLDENLSKLKEANLTDSLNEKKNKDPFGLLEGLINKTPSEVQVKKINISFELFDGTKISEDITLAMSPNSQGVFELGANIAKYTGLSLKDAQEYNETPDDAYAYGLVNTMNDGQDIYFWTNGTRLAGKAKKAGAQTAIIEQLAHEGVHLTRAILAKSLMGDKFPTGEWPSIGEQDNDTIEEEQLTTALSFVIDQISDPFIEMAKEYIPELNDQSISENLLNEGRYDKITRELTDITINAWKDDEKSGEPIGRVEFEVGPGKDFEYGDLEFIYRGIAVFANIYQYRHNGSATPDKGMVEVDFYIPRSELPKMWEKIYFDLISVIRHEIEHLTQSGKNVKGIVIDKDNPKLNRPGKQMADDNNTRSWLRLHQSTNKGTEYYELEKEVDANLQGLYLKAKKTRTPFDKVVDDYLKYDVKFTPSQIEYVKNVWRPRLKALSLPTMESREKVINESNEQTHQIYCDMDGVLVDFDKQFEKASGGISPREYEDKNGKEAFWNVITEKGVGFWVGMPWMVNGKQLWDHIKPYNPKLLSAPSRSNESRLGKRLWVRNNLPGTELILAYAENKKNYADGNNILIDDRPSNIDQWNAAGGIGILFISTAQTIEELKQYGL